MPQRLSSPQIARIHREAITILSDWLQAKRRGTRAPIGIANGALHLLELMRQKFPLEPDDYMSREKSQVRGLSGSSGDRIIRRFLPGAASIGTEAGRTSRGTLPAVEDLARRVNGVPDILSLTQRERALLADAMQRWITENPIRQYFEQQKLEPVLDPRQSSVVNIAAILRAAGDRNQAGPVAQHLVGAKLALRFPDLEIENHSYSTADVQLRRPGDFLVGDTAFHITMTPTPAVLEKCRRNLRKGYRAVLLVPEERREGAWQMAQSLAVDKNVAVLSIEAFVAQNIEELAAFTKSRIEVDLKRLLELYNERVKECETDPSLLIEIPDKLGSRPSS